MLRASALVLLLLVGVESSSSSVFGFGASIASGNRAQMAWSSDPRCHREREWSATSQCVPNSNNNDSKTAYICLQTLSMPFHLLGDPDVPDRHLQALRLWPECWKAAAPLLCLHRMKPCANVKQSSNNGTVSSNGSLVVRTFDVALCHHARDVCRSAIGNLTDQHEELRDLFKCATTDEDSDRRLFHDPAVGCPAKLGASLPWESEILEGSVVCGPLLVRRRGTCQMKCTAWTGPSIVYVVFGTAVVLGAVLFVYGLRTIWYVAPRASEGNVTIRWLGYAQIFMAIWLLLVGLQPLVAVSSSSLICSLDHHYGVDLATVLGAAAHAGWTGAFIFFALVYCVVEGRVAVQDPDAMNDGWVRVFRDWNRKDIRRLVHIEPVLVVLLVLIVSLVAACFLGLWAVESDISLALAAPGLQTGWVALLALWLPALLFLAAALLTAHLWGRCRFEGRLRTKEEQRFQEGVQHLALELYERRQRPDPATGTIVESEDAETERPPEDERNDATWLQRFVTDDMRTELRDRVRDSLEKERRRKRRAVRLEHHSHWWLVKLALGIALIWLTLAPILHYAFVADTPDRAQIEADQIVRQLTAEVLAQNGKAVDWLRKLVNKTLSHQTTTTTQEWPESVQRQAMELGWRAQRRAFVALLLFLLGPAVPFFVLAFFTNDSRILPISKGKRLLSHENGECQEMKDSHERETNRQQQRQSSCPLGRHHSFDSLEHVHAVRSDSASVVSESAACRVRGTLNLNLAQQNEQRRQAQQRAAQTNLLDRLYRDARRRRREDETQPQAGPSSSSSSPSSSAITVENLVQAIVSAVQSPELQSALNREGQWKERCGYYEQATTHLLGEMVVALQRLHQAYGRPPPELSDIDDCYRLFGIRPPHSAPPIEQAAIANQIREAQRERQQPTMAAPNLNGGGGGGITGQPLLLPPQPQPSQAMTPDMVPPAVAAFRFRPVFHQEQPPPPAPGL